MGQTAPSAIALAMLSSAATGAVACLLYGRIMHWLSPITVFVLGFVIGGTGLLLISQSSQYLLILAAAAVSGAGLGITIPNMNTMAALVSTPTNRGAVIGLAHGALFGGAPLVQFGFDFLIGSQSAGRAILLLGCMAWLLVGLWLLLGGKLLPAAPEPAPLPAG
jgi:MFS family permease